MKSIMRVSKMTIICFCIAMLTAAAARAAVADYLSRMPAQNAADIEAACKGLLEEGPGAVAEICAMLAPSTTGGDTGARYLVSAMAMYVIHDANSEPVRAMFAAALVDALGKAADTEVKAFLMAQLQMVGRDEAVAALAGYLDDDELCMPAAQALAAGNGAGAAEVLAKKLATARGGRITAVISALGELKALSAAEVIAPFVSSADASVRSAALSAIAKIAPPDASTVFEKAVADAPTAVERGAACNAWFHYAQARAEAKDKVTCETICRKLLAKESPVFVQCAALGTLAAVNGKNALPDLLVAADSPELEVRGAALLHAAQMKGAPVTKQFAAKLKGAEPLKKIEILDMLTRRGDASALPNVLEAMTDSEMYVRLAAYNAATGLGRAKVFPDLLKALQKAENPDEISALKDAILRMPGKKTTSSIVAALSETPGAPRKALLEIIAARGASGYAADVTAQAEDSDETVRIAALKALRSLSAPNDLPRLVRLLMAAKTDAEVAVASDTVIATAKQIEDPETRSDAVLAAFPDAGDKKPVLIKTLAGIGGKKALELVFSGAAAGDDAVKDASLRALADWPNADAAPILLDFAKTNPDESKQVIALRGYIKMAGMTALADSERAKMLDAAMTIAKRPDERTQALGALGAIRCIEALKVAEKYLADEALKVQAALAAVKIAVPQRRTEKGLVGRDVAGILKNALPLLADEQMKKDVQAHIDGMPIPDAEGFTPLFNGRDLTGWVGDTAGYTVENGVMICKPGGNLYTEKEYKDFIFRFEFKLTPNANNGLAIRAPLTGDGAYKGMEIQILDDTGSDYTELQPYQYHGSIYGIVPARKGFLKPVGEWNSEEVTVQGRRVIVKLNGEIIVDADLDKAAENGTMDNKDHPGLKNESGHIGFLGHGSVLEFRGMKVKEL